LVHGLVDCGGLVCVGVFGFWVLSCSCECVYCVADSGLYVHCFSVVVASVRIVVPGRGDGFCVVLAIGGLCIVFLTLLLVIVYDDYKCG